MRITWSRLLVLLIALPLGSCFDDEATCPTCPPANTSRIEVRLPLAGEIDSVHVFMDGAARVTVKRDQRRSFEGLSAGVHTVMVVRWFEDFGIVTSRTSTVLVKLDQGERRFIVFHNDFPLIADASPFGHPPVPLAVRLSHHGWASA